MEGLIKIEDLRIHCVMGVHAHERMADQELSLDIVMRVNLSEPVQTDLLVDTVNYEEVSVLCKELALTRQYHLLETFAHEALHAVMDTFSLSWAKICVRKPRALPLAKAVSVELEKHR